MSIPINHDAKIKALDFSRADKVLYMLEFVFVESILKCDSCLRSKVFVRGDVQALLDSHNRI